MTLSRTALSFVWILLSQVAAATEPTTWKLRHDPFERPAIGRQAGPSEATLTWPGQLRAVMRANDVALVNVDGTIIALGETVSGYRLIKVDERQALFIRDGVRFTLSLDKENAP